MTRSSIRSRKHETQTLDCVLQKIETQFDDEEEEEHDWECLDDAGQMLQLNLSFGPDYKDPENGPFESGVTTLHAHDIIMASDTKVAILDKPKFTQQVGEHHRQLKITGTRNVLVVRVDANDASTSSSEEDLARGIFGVEDSNGNKDDWNLSSAFNDCSYGQLKMEPTQHLRARNGVYTVSIDQNIRGARNNEVRNVILNKLRSDFGSATLNRLFDHVMLCLPPGLKSKSGE